MIIQVEFYDDSKKYYAECDLDCSPLPSEKEVLDTVLEKPDIVASSKNSPYINNNMSKSEKEND